ncbi:IS110 family transposase [Streptomyces sp. YIM S03343]
MPRVRTPVPPRARTAVRKPGSAQLRAHDSHGQGLSESAGPRRASPDNCPRRVGQVGGVGRATCRDADRPGLQPTGEGRLPHHASASYRGGGKTGAKDAYVIADQVCMRRGSEPLAAGNEIAVDPRILTVRRYGLAADRTWAINRMRAQMLEYFRALERAFDYSASMASQNITGTGSHGEAVRRGSEHSRNRGR